MHNTGVTSHVRALIAEGAGTFMFFFIGAGAIVATTGSDLVAIAFAHGLALAVAVKHLWSRLPTYWIAQLIGALAAGLAVRYSFDFAPTALDRTHLGTPGLGAGVTDVTAIVVEALLTVFLLWAVFGTAISPRAPRIAGFGIGLMVAADILVGAGITGAAMNPARWFGPA